MKMFILYDGRAKDGDTERAAVLITAESEQEAQRWSHDFKNFDAVWFEYDMVDGVAENQRQRDDIGSGILL